MHRGYIKIWRKIQDSFLNSNSELFHLWINLLLLASHKDTEFIFNGKKTVIKGGQFITGRQSLSLLTGIHESKIYRLLHILENEQLIEQQKTNLYTMVSIVNYTQYQENEQQTEQQMNNQRTTSEQPVNTINHKETQRNTKKNRAGFDFNSLWVKYPRRDGKKDAERHFRVQVKTEQDWLDINTALDNYLQSDVVKQGFIKNGSTWFNNWRDWIVPPMGSMQASSRGPGLTCEEAKGLN